MGCFDEWEHDGPILSGDLADPGLKALQGCRRDWANMKRKQAAARGGKSINIRIFHQDAQLPRRNCPTSRTAPWAALVIRAA